MFYGEERDPQNENTNHIGGFIGTEFLKEWMDLATMMGIIWRWQRSDWNECQKNIFDQIFDLIGTGRHIEMVAKMRMLVDETRRNNPIKFEDIGLMLRKYKKPAKKYKRKKIT